MSGLAVVTGAASGIGAAPARLLKKEGWRVIALDRNQPAETVDQFIKIDLGDEDSIRAAIAALPSGINALCNIAGMPPTAGARPTMRVNFFGLRDFTEGLLPKLADKASIVNIASLAGVGWPGNVERIKPALAVASLGESDAYLAQAKVTDEECYFLSKECLIVWTMKSWSRWRDRGIRMNSVSPGPVETPIAKDFLATLGERAAKDAERSERPAWPEDIAPIIAFLCRNESAWIRATNIQADWGLYAAAMEERLGF